VSDGIDAYGCDWAYWLTYASSTLLSKRPSRKFLCASSSEMALFFLAMPLAGASFLRLPMATAAAGFKRATGRDQVEVGRQRKSKVVEDKDKFGRHKLLEAPMPSLSHHGRST
jgi:hypothetical protein